VTPSSDHFGTIINESIDLHLYYRIIAGKSVVDFTNAGAQMANHRVAKKVRETIFMGHGRLYRLLARNDTT
jgi:hypothetical protein